MPHDFTADEIRVLKRRAALDLAAEEAERLDAERRSAAAAAIAEERAETERLQREGALILGQVGHNAVFDSYGCVCQNCMKLRANVAPIFIGSTADMDNAQ